MSYEFAEFEYENRTYTKMVHGSTEMTFIGRASDIVPQVNNLKNKNSRVCSAALLYLQDRTMPLAHPVCGVKVNIRQNRTVVVDSEFKNNNTYIGPSYRL
jgi:hypothetical protein